MPYLKFEEVPFLILSTEPGEGNIVTIPFIRMFSATSPNRYTKFG